MLTDAYETRTGFPCPLSAHCQMPTGQPSGAAEEPSPPPPPQPSGALADWLVQFELGQFASAIMDVQGIKTMETLRALSETELQKLIKNVDMKIGYKKEFIKQLNLIKQPPEAAATALPVRPYCLFLSHTPLSPY